MSIYIHKSLTRKKEEFIPLNPPRVKIYTCGVTVYDESHIGHARSLYIFDVIRRYLKYRGFKVKFVRNITDIDDKIINRAKELKIDWEDLVKKYIKSYNEDLRALEIEKADDEPRATENIPDMVKHIKGLIDKGYAYVTDSGVYFSVRKFKDYGRLSGQGIDQMLTGARIEPDEEKQDPLDFALWKKSKQDEPFWESPWGKGRPGWHIECSTMSMKYLKTDTLDIHAGGRDLIFPHHENEIAQAQALTDKPFAKYWIHHGLLTINGQKMAKSLGNFITVKDFISRYKNTDILKLFFLSTHYAHPIDYNEAKITEARQALERIMILLDRVERKVVRRMSQVAGGDFKELEGIKNKFVQAMDNDFNMPEGLASIFDLINLANKNIDVLDFISKAENLLYELTDIFNLDLKKTKTAFKNLPARITVLIDRRNEARKKGDFKEADRIRNELEEQSIILEDTKDGKTTWRKKL
jgi:cysteinyl-tRNA synthetase